MPNPINAGHELRVFQSWSEFVDKCAENSKKSGMMSNHRKRGGYNITDSLDEAMELARVGWAEYRPQVMELVADIEEDMRESLVDRSDEIWDVTGDYVDIGAYVSGVPECMVRMEPVKVSTEGRVISLLVCNAASAGVNEQEIVSRGSAICALVECLELCKHSTEIWTEQTVTGKRGRNMYTVLVKIKSAQDTLDIDKVLMAIAHPDTLRRLIFSVEEQEPSSIRQKFGFAPEGHTYGYPHELVMASQIDASINLDLMRYDRSIRNGADAGKWVREHLEKWGLLETVG